MLKVKNNRQTLRTFSYLSLIVLLLAGSPVLFYIGYVSSQTLHMVFSILGLFVALEMLRYCLQKQIKARQWVLEHIGATFGSGIGAYTAFVAFGGRTLLADLGQWQMLFWIAPGVIGGIASALLCKKYKNVFSVA